MANVVEEIKKIQKKFKVLKFNREEVTRVPEKNLTKALERYIRGFNQQIDNVHALIMAVQELKIEADEDPVEIREWSQKTKDELAEYDSFLEELEAHKAELQRRGATNYSGGRNTMGRGEKKRVQRSFTTGTSEIRDEEKGRERNCRTTSEVKKGATEQSETSKAGDIKVSRNAHRLAEILESI